MARCEQTSLTPEHALLHASAEQARSRQGGLGRRCPGAPGVARAHLHVPGRVLDHVALGVPQHAPRQPLARLLLPRQAPERRLSAAGGARARLSSAAARAGIPLKGGPQHAAPHSSKLQTRGITPPHMTAPSQMARDASPAARLLKAGTRKQPLWRKPGAAERAGGGARAWGREARTTMMDFWMYSASCLSMAARKSSRRLFW